MKKTTLIVGLLFMCLILPGISEAGSTFTQICDIPDNPFYTQCVLRGRVIDGIQFPDNLYDIQFANSSGVKTKRHLLEVTEGNKKAASYRFLLGVDSTGRARYGLMTINPAGNGSMGKA